MQVKLFWYLKVLSIELKIKKKVVFVEVQASSYFGEDDIVRIENDYNRV